MQASIVSLNLNYHRHSDKIDNLSALNSQKWSRPKQSHIFSWSLKPARNLNTVVVAMAGENSPQTLMDYLGKEGADVGDDMVILFGHLQFACKRIAALLASPWNSTVERHGHAASAGSNTGRDVPKPLDIVSNDIIKSALQNSGKVAVLASEEEELPAWLTNDGPYVMVIDPLDGSRNIDASIPTGTIFGIYHRLPELDDLPIEEKASVNVLQTGSRLVGAGYILYSSATILCMSIGSGTHGFTLDHSMGEFVLTHPNIVIPEQEGLRRYIDAIRQGKGKNPKKYSARYICSLVADFHRTLLYGGIAMNPRDHLRLVYEANPLSFLVEHAGGSGTDGKRRILAIQPVELHQRLPLFLGSSADISELQSYDDIQQLINPGYEV